MSVQEGEIVHIFLAKQGFKPKLKLQRMEMEEVTEVMAEKSKGLVGDRYHTDNLMGTYSQTSRIPDDHRQATFTDIEKFWEAVAEMKGNFEPKQSRRNFFTKGIDWRDTEGATVTIPVSGAEFHVWEECTPCQIPDEGKLGFKNAFTPEWRGGVRTEITGTGLIAVAFTVLVSS